MKYSIEQQIERIGIVSVFTSPGAEIAVEAAQVLTEEGFPLFEVTFRNEAARDSIAAVVKRVPNALVGAGTVLTVDQAKQALDVGARFFVSPGFAPDVAQFCLDNNVPYYPGTCTPTEMQAALRAGFNVLKFFPAEANGGVATIQALAAAFPQVRFMPTGGIDVNNVASYLSLAPVVACGGSWLAPKAAVAARDWAKLRAVARHTASVLYGVAVHEGKTVVPVANVDRTNAYLERCNVVDAPRIVAR